MQTRPFFKRLTSALMRIAKGQQSQSQPVIPKPDAKPEHRQKKNKGKGSNFLTNQRRRQGLRMVRMYPFAVKGLLPHQ